MTGKEDRDRGQADVIAADQAGHRGAKHHIETALAQLARSGREFTADDVRALLPDGTEPHSPNLIPAVMGGWACARKIVPVRETHSARRSRRWGRNRVWIGRAKQAA